MENKELIGKEIKAVPAQELNIGVDLEDNLAKEMVEASQQDILNVSALESFSTVAQTREQLYQCIDTMSNDSTISSVLETYAEDTTVANEQGRIVWVESSDEKCAKYVTYLLDTLNVDKNAYAWVYSMYKYGDLYLKLFRESDYNNDLIFNSENVDARQTLNESKTNEAVEIFVSKKSDRYVPYVEAVRNPGEMFELTRYGKTMGYIKAPVNLQKTNDITANALSYSSMYRLKKADVEVYQATDFVHGCLEDNISRTDEEVNIYMTDKDFEEDTNSLSYNVRRGQSLLYNSFKIWRQLSLLENSVMLDRLTKSSILRLVQIEVGDMPKEQVQSVISNIKTLIEQKTAINTTEGTFSEYNNPGPIQNTIYTTTHEGKGAISVQTIGGDVDPKSLIDIEYYRDKLFASLKAPKQFFGFTEDSTGFNGGTSLSIISSRYGKSVKRGQNTFVQVLSDLINLFLFDRGLTSYINKFQLKMVEPITQEEIDKKEAASNSIRIINDIMQTIEGDINDSATRLKIKKALLSPVVSNPDVLTLLQEEIDRQEEEGESVQSEQEENAAEKEEEPFSRPRPFEREEESEEESPFSKVDFEEVDLNPQPEKVETGEETIVAAEDDLGEALEIKEDIDLPTGNELGVDLTKNY